MLHGAIKPYPILNGSSNGSSIASGASGISVYVTAATLIGAVALWQQEGRVTVMLPVMAFLILVSHRSRFRIEGASLRFLCRLVLYTAVLVMYRVRPPNSENTFIDPFVLSQCGELCAAEIVIRAWSRYTALKYNRSIVILLVGTIFVVATNTYDDNVGRYFTPVFMVLLAMGMQTMRAPALPDASRRARSGVVIAVSSAALLGAILYYALYINRDALTEWANRALNGSNVPITATGLSDVSHLGSVFGRSGSYDRVMRIHTAADVSYMRAYSMNKYEEGYWGPPARPNTRPYEPVNENDLQTNLDGSAARVYRYSSNTGLVFMPLNAVSININDTVGLRWDRQDGGPLRCDIPGPDSYSISIGAPEQQGIICTAPDKSHLEDLLVVPKSIDSRIHELANRITEGISDPLEKARAIEAYLPAHHAYSQRIRVGTRDPLGDFLFSDKAAHCEFFASAAVVLMRCAGIPARYVIGYFAHEGEGGDVVVRQRDAHAWAECWIKGAGWITIDATPASGRPNGNIESIPSWKHAIEKLQDWFASARERFNEQNLLRIAGMFICLALTVYLLQIRYHFNWRREPKQVVREYSRGGEELRRHYSRFETTCRRFGLYCPPSISWRQYLGDLLINSDVSPQTNQQPEFINAALEFIAAYDRGRFGRSLDPDGYSSLRSKLDVMERVAKGPVTKEKSV